MIQILRGPSGSGKSYIGHRFVDTFPHEEIFEDGWNKIKPRMIGYRLPGGLTILGSYRAAGGGLDTLSPQDRSRHFELIKRHAANGHVFAEALVLSTMIPKLIEMGNEVGKENITFSTLDTPPDKCIRQVYQRNGGKQIKEENVYQHRRSVDNGTRRLAEAGFTSLVVDHTRGFETVMDVFTGAGWRPYASGLVPDELDSIFELAAGL